MGPWRMSPSRQSWGPVWAAALVAGGGVALLAVATQRAGGWVLMVWAIMGFGLVLLLAYLDKDL